MPAGSRSGGTGGGQGSGRDGAGVPRVDPSSSFIIKVIDYREPLDEGILRCGERRSKAVFLSPAESSARTHIGTPTGCPDRASSPEITATSTDAAALCISQKTAHERYLGHRRSSQSEELTTRTCIAPARCAPKNDG